MKQANNTKQTSDPKLDELVNRIFMAGYQCGKKESGLQMVIANEVIEPAAIAELIAWKDAAVVEARIEDNHEWDTETFKPITVCSRCATTYQIKGNKRCKGKMAKVGLRDTHKEKGQEDGSPL